MKMICNHYLWGKKLYQRIIIVYMLLLHNLNINAQFAYFPNIIFITLISYKYSWEILTSVNL